MFSIEMLPAGHGDALVIEYGTPTDKHHILIDAGTIHTWPAVRNRLKQRRKDRYEVFIVTHVDEDHIGGSISLLDDPDLKHRLDHVWFNGFIHCSDGGNVLGPVHGEQLTSRIVEGGFRWNDPFPNPSSPAAGGPAVVPSAGDLPTFDLPGGAKVVLLSPTGPKLKKMAKVWKTKVEEAHLVAGHGDADHAGAFPPHDQHVVELPIVIGRAELELAASETERDGSEANGSSIAFVLEFGNKRLLLGADAHADVLAANLARYGQMKGEARPRIDVVKLSHHGSGANLSSALVAAIDTRRYLISSNGDNFGHPDDSAIARAILGSSGPVTFWCNYASKRTGPWVQRGAAVGATFVLPKPGKSGIRVTV